MKKLNYLAYYFVFVVLYCLLIFTNSNVKSIFKYIGLGLIAILLIIAIIYFVLFTKLRKQNEKLYKMIDDKEYDEVITFINNKLNKKVDGFQKDIYNFLLTLAYVYKDDKNKLFESIERINNKDVYPQVYYYIACYNFLEDKYEELALYHHKFVDSFQYKKQPEAYSNLNKVFRAICKYSESIEEAQKMIEMVDKSSFTVPCSIKAIDKIKNSMQ